jgi:hypothetical protein
LRHAEPPDGDRLARNQAGEPFLVQDECDRLSRVRTPAGSPRTEPSGDHVHRAELDRSLLLVGAHKRYFGVVRTTGGLKLALEGTARDDRRVRFADVSVAAADATVATALVTDSQGRMRYRLPDGEYVLRAAGGDESRFTVRDGRWTTVRMRLP